MNTRLIAARVIDAVINGASLADVLPHYQDQMKDARDRALVQAIVYGICRHYEQLDIMLSQLLQRPMREKDSDVFALILVGLYQLMHMRVPEHAAVSETVNASQKLKKPWARGFINAILREYLRNKDKLTAAIADDEEATYSHPVWLMRKIKKVWPLHWQAILIANNEHPPFSLRVNLSKKTREEYMRVLDTEILRCAQDDSETTRVNSGTTRVNSGTTRDNSEKPVIQRHEVPKDLTIIPETTSGIMLSPPVPVEELPGFAEGDISVQDGAAQLAAELLQLGKGQRVLDACAAPGGKLMHILESESSLDSVVAVEIDAGRIKSIDENLKRGGFELTCIKADIVNTISWWDQKPFDRILLDAPCSASGVIRRHPDIKLLRQEDDIEKMADEQLKILSALWQTLKPEGILLYVTCSIFPEENAEVIRQFLQKHTDAKEDNIDAAWGVACDFGRQILPGMHQMDGFYYARLCKSSAG